MRIPTLKPLALKAATRSLATVVPVKPYVLGHDPIDRTSDMADPAPVLPVRVSAGPLLPRPCERDPELTTFATAIVLMNMGGPSQVRLPPLC